MPSVAIFLNQFLPLSEVFVYHQAKSLSRYTPHFVAAKKVSPSVDVGDIPSFILNNQTGRSGKINEALFKATRYSPALERQLKQNDIIHAHFGPTGWMASRMAQHIGKPLVTTLHGFDVLKDQISLRDDGLLQTLYSRGRTQFGHDCAQFICVSDYIKKRAIAFGFPEDKCVVSYLGIPLLPHTEPKYEQNSPDVPIRLLAAGRLVPFKAHSKLISAVSALQKDGYNVHLDIAGDGPLRGELEKQAAESLSAYKFWGALPHNQITSLMRQSDIFCHTSMHMPNGQTEALGLVVLEAQWAGLPVVAFRSGGVPEALQEGTTGLLCEEGDIGAFKQALIHLITHPEQRLAMGRAAPEFVRSRFDNTQQGHALERIYDSVLSRKTRAPSC